MLPAVAAGKSVGKAPPLESKAKYAVIGEVMSAPALEVVDHVAGIQFWFTGQPVVFAGCGPPPRTSTLFWAIRGATPSSNGPPNKNNIRIFLMDLFLPELEIRKLLASAGCAA